MYQYLKDTRREGIHYWRKDVSKDCPNVPIPKQLTDYSNYTAHECKKTKQGDVYNVYVDASYSNHDINR